MRGSSGVAKLGPQEWECRPEQMKPTREGGADRENTQRGQQRGRGKDNTDSRTAAPNGKERTRENERTETKKKRETLIFDTRCSRGQLGRKATLNKSGGPTIDVRVGKEAAKGEGVRDVDACVNAEQVAQEKV